MIVAEHQSMFRRQAFYFISMRVIIKKCADGWMVENRTYTRQDVPVIDSDNCGSGGDLPVSKTEASLIPLCVFSEDQWSPITVRCDESSGESLDFEGFKDSKVDCVTGCVSTKKIHYTTPAAVPRRGQECAHCERKFYLQGRKENAKWIFCSGCYTWVCPTCRASEWPCVCPPVKRL